MGIKEIREKARLTPAEIGDLCASDIKSLLDAQITKYENTEIVLERECKDCEGDGTSGELAGCGLGLIHLEDCLNCNGTGKLPPITVEQAIREKLR